MKSDEQPPHINEQRLPPAAPWAAAADQIKGQTGKPTARLQCRSFPPGIDIIIDGEHTGQETPHTFNNLPKGNHTVEMQYVAADGTIETKKENVSLKIGKRVVCKLRFIEPKTLA